MNLGLAKLRASDEPRLAAFFSRCAGREELRFFDPFPLTTETAQRLCVEPTRDRYFVAGSDDQIVGLSMLRGWDEGFEIPSLGVMVDPDHQGRGLGSRLTDYTIAAARDLGCESVRLSVYGGNEQAASMYRRRGFVEISRDRVERHWGADTRVVMIKHFSDAEAGA